MISLINNQEDAEQLEDLFNVYMKRHTGTSLPYIDIVKAFIKLKPYENHGSRLFAALIDLKINFVFLLLDSFYAGAIWNDQNSLSISKEDSILNNPTLFDKRLEIHRHNANYIPRYRAMWDKIMGILLLISSEEKYDKYNSSKSRKKAFKNLSSDITFLNANFTENILDHIQKFDDNFRTGEVHRFGSLRKYSFLHNPFDKEEFLEFKSSYNYMLFMLVEVDKIIESIK